MWREIETIHSHNSIVYVKSAYLYIIIHIHNACFNEFLYNFRNVPPLS